MVDDDVDFCHVFEVPVLTVLHLVMFPLPKVQGVNIRDGQDIQWVAGVCFSHGSWGTMIVTSARFCTASDTLFP